MDGLCASWGSIVIEDLVGKVNLLGSGEKLWKTGIWEICGPQGVNDLSQEVIIKSPTQPSLHPCLLCGHFHVCVHA